MIQGSIATRYARALYEEAKAQLVDKTVYDHLGTLQATLKAEPDLQEALINPRIKNDKKYQLLLLASGIADTEEAANTLYKRFVRILLENHRENKVRLITYVYRDIYRQANNIDRVVFETAVAMPTTVITHLSATIKAHTHREVECECVVNPDIIGGFRLRIGDNRYDYSYKTKLEKIRTCLTR